MNYYIGLMSGTSMDGIDCALVDVTKNQLISSLTYAYDKDTYRFLLKLLANEAPPLQNLYQLHAMIGNAFAIAANKLIANAEVDRSKIKAIGSHGQTIRHDVNALSPYSMQLGCGHTLAELTGLPVITDFRTRDLVVGGQGAPLAPVYHQALFKNFQCPLAVVNIGGIANITVINAKGVAIKGYDTGPGNCLMDRWVKKHLDKSFDQSGRWAETGKLIPELLDAWLKDPYFKRKPPKSLDKAYFSENWLNQSLLPAYRNEDIQATLTALTAITIARAILEHGEDLQTVILCGGGAHNLSLRKYLSNYLPGRRILSTEVIGVNPDYVEAMMMAWLAHQRTIERPIDLSLITGARKSAILGVVYPPGIDKGNSLGL